jgi:hypothetical protein
VDQFRHRPSLASKALGSLGSRRRSRTEAGWIDYLSQARHPRSFFSLCTRQSLGSPGRRPRTRTRVEEPRQHGVAAGAGAGSRYQHFADLAPCPARLVKCTIHFAWQIEQSSGKQQLGSGGKRPLCIGRMRIEERAGSGGRQQRRYCFPSPSDWFRARTVSSAVIGSSSNMVAQSRRTCSSAFATTSRSSLGSRCTGSCAFQRRGRVEGDHEGTSGSAPV